MSKSNKKIPPAGQIRQSQILSTFGSGSMVDLQKKAEGRGQKAEGKKY